jgi:DNA-binding transcriptional LysR family regulator
MDNALARKQWLGVEFRHLAALTAIAEEGTFRGAADRLGYVQSAVSQQIAFLERSLGTRLIDRSRGSQPVELTDAGRVVLDHFEHIVVKLAAAWADIDALSAGRAGVVRLGIAPSVEARVMPQVLSRLARDTDISVQVTECDDDTACTALVETRVDAALISGQVPDGPVVAHRVIEDPLVLLVQADAPLARRGTAPSLAEIGALALIARCGSADADAAFRELERQAIEPRIVYATDDDATVHALVASGVGGAVIPALAVDWNDDTVAALPLDEILPARVLSLVWHADRRLTPTLETFCDEILAACRAIQREIDQRYSRADGAIARAA